MGLDGGLARAFGLFTLGVITIGTSGLAVVGAVTGDIEIFEMLAPVVVVYSGILVIFALGISLLVFVSRRRGEPI